MVMAKVVWVIGLVPKTVAANTKSFVLILGQAGES